MAGTTTLRMGALAAALLLVLGCDTVKRMTPADIGAADVPVVDERLDAGETTDGSAPTDGGAGDAAAPAGD